MLQKEFQNWKFSVFFGELQKSYIVTYWIKTRWKDLLLDKYFIYFLQICIEKNLSILIYVMAPWQLKSVLDLHANTS